MPTSPQFLVWVILSGVLTAVLAAVAVTIAKRGGLGGDGFLLFACTWFGTSLLGYFVTAFSSPTLESWWWSPLGRVVWQLSGSCVLAMATLGQIGARSSWPFFAAKEWAIGAGLFAFGFVLCYNPALDLLVGPLALHDIVEFHVDRSRGRGAKIWATLRARTADGGERQFDFRGWTANDAEARLKPCLNGKAAQIAVLRHLERVIDVRCQ